MKTVELNRVPGKLQVSDGSLASTSFNRTIHIGRQFDIMAGKVD